MFKIYNKEKIKRTSLSVGGATDLPKDHQLQRLPLLAELGGWHQCQQVEEVVVVRAMVEEVVETEAYLAIHQYQHAELEHSHETCVIMLGQKFACTEPCYADTD